jgi:Transposase DDE domain
VRRPATELRESQVELSLAHLAHKGCVTLVEVFHDIAKEQEERKHRAGCPQIDEPRQAASDVTSQQSTAASGIDPPGSRRCSKSRTRFAAIDEQRHALLAAEGDGLLVGELHRNVLGSEALRARTMPAFQQNGLKRRSAFAARNPRGMRYRQPTQGHGPRWLVERTFAWPGRCRGLSKDIENLTRTHAAFVTLAIIRIMAAFAFPGSPARQFDVPFPLGAYAGRPKHSESRRRGQWRIDP